MRIGIDCRLWNESGVGRYTRNLVRELLVLDTQNVYVLFILSKDAEEFKEFSSRVNCRIVTADIRWHTLREQLLFPRILYKEKLDLMHFPYFSVPIFYIKPYIVTIHDLILHHFPTGQASTLPLPFYYLKHFGYKTIITFAGIGARQILTVSETTKKELMDHLRIPDQKITVTYEGIESTLLEEKEKPEFAHLKNKKYFLYVGNAYPHKNLERLLKAFKNVVSRNSSANLVLIGREDFFYKKLKEKVQSLGLEEQVSFFQNIPDAELGYFYKNAQALVMPSLMEGFGLPVIEAMSKKCPVLVSDIPAFREICEDAAYYFNPFDISEIQSRMEKALSLDISRKSKNVLKGLERSKDFSWEKMAKETLEVYESSISIRPS